MDAAQAGDTAAPDTSADSLDVSTADLLAGLAELETKDRGAADTTADAEVEVVETAGEEPADAEATEEDAEEAEEAEPEAEAEPEDDDKAKRLEAIQRNEKRAREQVEQFRAQALAEIKAKEAELSAREEKARRYEEARARRDAVAVLEELGFDVEDQLRAAKRIFTSAMAKKEPEKYRDAAERLRREDETVTKQSALEKRIEELNAKLERQEQERHFEGYFSQVERAVGDDAPIMGKLIKARPDVTRQRVRMVADHLRQQTGEEPSPADVIKILEENEREYLKALGYVPDTAGKTATTKTKTQEAGERKTATSSKAPPPKPPPDAPVDKAQLIAELEELQQKGSLPS